MANRSNVWSCSRVVELFAYFTCELIKCFSEERLVLSAEEPINKRDSLHNVSFGR